ncbi:MAG: aldo/keto reductase [Thaumarchaeota archaeon]|nr:aldo/keto reductase [Nitrososphaerota archaeon]
MKYVNLGNSGLLVSQFCIGGWQLPGSGSVDESGVESVDVEDLKRVLKKAVDYGVNFIDTANRYHGRMSPTDLVHAGGSERVIGQVLKGFEREYFVIATKVSARMSPWPNGEGLSRKHMMWQIRESLKRLEMDYVDLYQLHSPDPLTPKLETLKTLDNLVKNGWVRYVGESNYPTEEIQEFMQLAEDHDLEGFVSMQELYNLLERGVEAKLPLAKGYKMALLAYSPLAQGILAGKYMAGVQKGDRASYAEDPRRFSDAGVLKVLPELEILAKEESITLSQLSLAWMLKKQETFGVTIIPVVGITRLSHLEDDVGALEVNLDSTVEERMDELVSNVTFAPPA